MHDELAEIRDFISECPPFDRLDAAALAAVTPRFVIRYLRLGEGDVHDADGLPRADLEALWQQHPDWHQQALHDLGQRLAAAGRRQRPPTERDLGSPHQEPDTDWRSGSYWLSIWKLAAVTRLATTS